MLYAMRRDPAITENETSRKGIYIGESSQSLYERSKEHVADARDFKEGSHMVKHWLSSYEGEKEQPEFNIQGLLVKTDWGSHSNPLIER